jgi:subtilase family serine protease
MRNDRNVHSRTGRFEVSNSTTGRHALGRVSALVFAALALVLVIGTTVASAAPGTARPIGSGSAPKRLSSVAAGPGKADCLAAFGTPCYSPQEMRKAYGVDQLLGAGGTGAGQTIVLIDSFGSPTALSDLQTFDKAYGLPDPPSFKVFAPLGAPAFDPTNDDMVGWAEETSLDVQWAHAMAPAANIVLATSPVSETEGTQGLPEFLTLMKDVVNNHMGQIISNSWGATEETLFDPAGRAEVGQYEQFFEQAARQHVTILASSGDDGSTDTELDLSTLYPFPVASFPNDSPFVTSVGGTSLFTDANGNYQSETVWNNDIGAGGGGVSKLFAEPLWQRLLPFSTQRQLAGHRGAPDLSWNADPDTGAPVYLGFLGANNGFYIFGGTSASSPQVAGVVADLNQLLRRPIGLLNPYLYLLGITHHGFHDVTVGNNAFAGVPGFAATPGWDLATGWGSPDLGQFFHALAAMPIQS